MQPVILGLLASFVGFSSSFAVVLQGYLAMGATPAQAASGLTIITFCMGALGAWFSFRTRMPVAIAWSTPGAALLVASLAPAGGFAAAVGAFIISGLLIMLAGLWRPLLRAVEGIPGPIANAMLAGVLLDLCVSPARAVGVVPWIALPVVLTWLIMLRLARLWAVPAAVVVAAGLVAVLLPLPPGAFSGAAPRLEWVWPVFEPAAILGIGVPLFLVTMASQNVPGIAVLSAFGYRPKAGQVFLATGAASAAGALVGGQMINFAAITAAMCAGPESHPDPKRRWVAAFANGCGYMAIALAAGLAAAAVAVAPPALIQAVAGLALLGSMAGALRAAVEDEGLRIPAVLCFVTCASGLSFAGVGPAFWGLLSGLAAAAVLRRP
ncbi:benzoate/H(+) symporter BenE family transporter [Rhodovarius sp.]|jgi:benzoate membrane transport protein|uniref:benzoate/H(+) symporter BenE family transporter n=1 Tax=Rhodovarius sp. TaxID=2972673 RepID=UPI003340D960